jgi:hypothetical protein
MRRVLILVISLVAFGLTAAPGAASAEPAHETARSAPDSDVDAVRQGQREPNLRHPRGAGGPQSVTSSATSQAHAALRQRMLGLIQRPATAAAGPARSPANLRSVIRIAPNARGSRPGAYRQMPAHGALGGPTITRSAAKVLSGVQRRPL